MPKLAHRRSHLVFVVTLLAACGGAPQMRSVRVAEAPVNVPAVPPLERSLFARDPSGAITEEQLQQILAAPIELELPARVGVMPITTATDWRGPGPDLERAPIGVGPLVERLRKDPAFLLVTQTMPIPSGSLGMEALREAAARYRLRYLLLYREIVREHTTLNGWAWGYATVLGAFMLPGQHHQLDGYVEATMFDVKTGTLMFTTRRVLTASTTTNRWHQDEKIAALAGRALTRFTPELAADVVADLRRYAAAADAENARREVPVAAE